MNLKDWKQDKYDNEYDKMYCIYYNYHKNDYEIGTLNILEILTNNYDGANRYRVDRKLSFGLLQYYTTLIEEEQLGHWIHVMYKNEVFYSLHKSNLIMAYNAHIAKRKAEINDKILKLQQELVAVNTRPTPDFSIV